MELDRTFVIDNADRARAVCRIIATQWPLAQRLGRPLAARGAIGSLPTTTPREPMQHGQTENATPDFGAAINEQFRQFCAQQADLLIQNHGIVRGAAIVAIDGNGYISVASFGTSPTGVNLLLADALALNQSRQPDVELRMAAGQTVNELATATPEHAAALAGDAPVLALEDDEGRRTVEAAPQSVQH